MLTCAAFFSPRVSSQRHHPVSEATQIVLLHSGRTSQEPDAHTLFRGSTSRNTVLSEATSSSRQGGDTVVFSLRATSQETGAHTLLGETRSGNTVLHQASPSLIPSQSLPFSELERLNANLPRATHFRKHPGRSLGKPNTPRGKRHTVVFT